MNKKQVEAEDLINYLKDKVEKKKHLIKAAKKKEKLQRMRNFATI